MCIYKMYHYTNESGFASIRKSKRITMSEGRGDAVYGTGVYLTEYSPWDYSKKEIAENNWGDNAIDRCMYVIEVHLPDTKLFKRRENVWLFCEEVDLYICKVQFIVNKGFTPQVTCTVT